MVLLDLNVITEFAENLKTLMEAAHIVYEELQYEGVLQYDVRPITFKPDQRSSIYYYSDLKGVIWKTFDESLSLKLIDSFDKFVVKYSTTPTNFSGGLVFDMSMDGSHGVSVYVPRGTNDYKKEDRYYSTLEWYKYFQK